MFLNLPQRENKPRSKGITMVIDPGLTTGEFENHIEVNNEYIDYVKFGWGTSIVSKNIADKTEILRRKKIKYWLGGTLFELAHKQNKIKEYFSYAEELGCEIMEISDGSIQFSRNERNQYIKEANKRFKVVTEVGSKDKNDIMPPSKWVEEIKSDLDMGAWKVIAEGRESGNVGIYRETGEVRVGLIKDMLNANIDMHKVIFEAPQRKQQIWFIKNIGYECNLGNIEAKQIISLETLRLGLRGDTIEDQ